MAALTEIICKPMALDFGGGHSWAPSFGHDLPLFKESAQATDRTTDVMISGPIVVINLLQQVQVKLLQRENLSAPKPAQHLRHDPPALVDGCVRITTVTKPVNEIVHMSAKDWKRAPTSQSSRMTLMKRK